MVKQAAVGRRFTCAINSCFNVIHMPPQHITSEVLRFTEVCKLLWSSDTLLPQLECMWSIVWVKLAQESSQFCFASKASHAPSSAQTMQMTWARPARCASASYSVCLVGMYRQNSLDQRWTWGPTSSGHALSTMTFSGKFVQRKQCKQSQPSAFGLLNNGLL